MTDDEVRAYLCRWVMEFGTGPVNYDNECLRNDWYMSRETESVVDIPKKYMRCIVGCDAITITQAGLDLIRGDPDDAE